MQIGKVIKFISKIKRKPLKNHVSTISSLLPKSTLIGRKKIEQLKKIGKNKRGVI
jgi:hypothetical protein